MDVLIDYFNELNWVAVLLATVAAFVVGAVWYSNALFGKQWQKGAKLSDSDLKNADMVKPMVGGLVSTFVGALSIGIVFDVLALEGAFNGALLGGLVAVGFVVSNKIMHCLFEQKPFDYVLVTATGDVVAMAVMGAVYALVR